MRNAIFDAHGFLIFGSNARISSAIIFLFGAFTASFSNKEAHSFFLRFVLPKAARFDARGFFSSTFCDSFCKRSP
jgi:TRAP-type uncharacterized transport system fused permease subunit